VFVAPASRGAPPRPAAGDTKARALLHGHSYTAHPVGCAAALQALDSYADPALNPNLCTPAAPGRCRRGGACAAPCGRAAPLWPPARVAALAARPGVAGVVALGSVLAVELQAAEAGYGSGAAAAAVARLRARGVYARPLGNVVYLMVTPMTRAARCEALLDALEASL
jgi:dethiobiotin synthetase/adenosylmethionine--8-amino-7-oxononanoate aminotransferase